MPPTPEQLHSTAMANEVRLTTIEQRLADHRSDYEAFRKALAEAAVELRELEDWRLEVNVYLRQIRWLIVLVAAALITGVINILLNLELHVH